MVTDHALQSTLTECAEATGTQLVLVDAPNDRFRALFHSRKSYIKLCHLQKNGRLSTDMSARSSRASGRVITRKPAGSYPTYKAARRSAAFAGTGLGARPARDYNPARAVMPTETKYFDTSFGQSISTAADWTGSEVPCVNYIQSDGTTVGVYTDSALIPSAIGAGYGQVNGNKYYLKRLRLKGTVIPAVGSDQADVPAAASVRILLVQDLQPQGAQAQGESILTDMGSATQAHFSFMAMAAGSGGRFRILKDKVFMCQPGPAGTDGASTVSTVRQGFNFKMQANFAKPIQVQLKANSATPTVASLSNCNFFLLAHCTLGTATLSGCARAYFQD